MPAPGSRTIHYGGNTSCTELRTDDGTLIIMDCGTGARELGLDLLQKRPVRAHILITHTHRDHIQGFPFFAPVFLPDSEITVYAPAGFIDNLEHALAGQMQYSYFPVKLRDLASRMRFLDVDEGGFQIGNVAVQTQFLNHTSPTIGYRITSGGITVVYATDHEPYTMPSGSLVHPGDQRHTEFLEKADLVIHDAQYTEDEYPSKLGWGHSTLKYATDVAIEAGARRLVLYHHDPTHDDPTIERLEAECQAHAMARRSTMEVVAAAEGLTIYLPEQTGHVPMLGTRSALDRRPVNGARVLIATDNQAHAGAVIDVLRQEGLEPAVINDVGRLHEEVHRFRPHAVVLDAELFDGRVYEAAAALGADFRALDTALILLAPALDDDTIHRARAAGVTDCLATPFSPPMLYARIKAWLSRYYRPEDGRTVPGSPAAGDGDAAAAPVQERLRSLPDEPAAEGKRSRQKKASLLAATHVFAVLDEASLEKLAEGARHCSFDPGEPIVEQGAHGRSLYVILSGRVRVVGRPAGIYAGEILLDELGPGDVFGELSSIDDQPHSATVLAVTPTDCLRIPRSRLLEALASSPAFSLRLLRTLAHRLREADQMLTRGGPDALTGLSARQTLEEQYRREAAATRRRDQHLALLLVDIDDLNAINTAYGHIVGDEALRVLADALRTSTRDSDLLARAGGDNFIVILPDAGPDGARLVAARIHRSLEQLVEQRSLPMRLTCTIEWATTSDPPATLEDWLLQLVSQRERTAAG